MTRQRAVLDWAVRIFGIVARDRQERASRLLEECLEVAQAEGLPVDLVNRIVARTYSRPAGDLRREIGQLAITLDATAENLGFDVQEEARRELDRVMSIPAEVWRARHANKADQGTAKPARSAP